MTLLINPDRLQHDFNALSQIGATPEGGVNRPALSPAHLEARAWFLQRAAEAGLAPHVDGAGNHSAILQSSNSPRTLLLGSHLDSVPNGGRYDGALGVLAALEVLRTVKDAGLTLPINLEAIDFTDEEGTLVGLLGSQALAGSLTAEALQQPRGGRAVLEAGMRRAGLTDASCLAAKRDPRTLAGYLELHIEQGPRLTQAALAIGVVSGIVGIRSLRLTFYGQANHAGTTPMNARADAGLGASVFLVTAREMVARDFPMCAINVGQMAFQPGAFNIIPGVAELAVEFRAPEIKMLSELDKSVRGLADLIARQYSLRLQLAEAGACVPAPMSQRAQTAITTAVESLALTHTTLFSGAGHDAQSLAPLTEAGMIFVPSREGISHSPREFTEWDDCVNGANVLLRAAVGMSEQ